MATKGELFGKASEMAKKLRTYKEKYEKGEATRADADQAKGDRKEFNNFVESQYQKGVFNQEDVSLLYGAATGEMVDDFSLFRAIKEGRDHPTLRFVREQSEKREKERGRIRNQMGNIAEEVVVIARNLRLPLRYLAEISEKVEAEHLSNSIPFSKVAIVLIEEVKSHLRNLKSLEDIDKEFIILRLEELKKQYLSLLRELDFGHLSKEEIG